MMKNLLVLMLVLVMAAGANATLQLSLNGSPAPDEYTMNVCGTVKIDVTSSVNGAYLAYLELADKGKEASGLAPTFGEWVPPMTILPEAGEMAKVTPDFMGYLSTWELSAAGVTTPVTPGKHFEIDFHCTAMGDAVILLYDINWDVPVDTLTIHQIPEPASMLLLGLGGLLLRRRK
jgi:hypothetical protein